jgi:hypothetical protein
LVKTTENIFCELQKETIMPAGYSATTNMESALTTGFEFTAELSDLRIIELPAGTSRPPSNIIQPGSPFAFYTDIIFVGVPTPPPPLPNVAVDIQWYVEGIGGAAFEGDTPEIFGAYVGPALAAPLAKPLQWPVPGGVTLNIPGIYKAGASVRVRWATAAPGDVNSYFMWGFIEGAPFQIAG